VRFAIRDDDTNYFTKPEQLERNYEDVWNICPLSLSVVPFHGCTKSGAIPQRYWASASNIRFPVGENKEIVAFLKEKLSGGCVSIMLHGHSHEDSPAGYEFEVEGNLFEKVKTGKEYLESLFGVKVGTFVPPHNKLSREGLRAVVKNGLNIVGVASFRERHSLRWQNIANYIKIKYFHLKWQRPYPYALDFGDHKEVSFYGVVPSITFRELKAAFDFVYQRDGDFVLAAHYWEFNVERPMNIRDAFDRFWSYVQGFRNIQFCTVDELFASS